MTNEWIETISSSTPESMAIMAVLDAFTLTSPSVPKFDKKAATSPTVALLRIFGEAGHTIVA
jgi:hypothetical protein